MMVKKIKNALILSRKNVFVEDQAQFKSSVVDVLSWIN